MRTTISSAIAPDTTTGRQEDHNSTWSPYTLPAPDWRGQHMRCLVTAPWAKSPHDKYFTRHLRRHFISRNRVPIWDKSNSWEVAAWTSAKAPFELTKLHIAVLEDVTSALQVLVEQSVFPRNAFHLIGMHLNQAATEFLMHLIPMINTVIGSKIQL